MPKSSLISKEILQAIKEQTNVLRLLLTTQQNKPVSVEPGEELVGHSDPLFITSADVAVVLGLSSTYAGAKLRVLKRKCNIPLEDPLTVREFCKVTKLPYADVVRLIKRC